MAHIAILTVFILTILKGDASPCSSEACSGPYQMNKLDTIITRNHSYVTRGFLSIIITEVHMTVIEKLRFRKYCYNGGSIDSNTGCIGGLAPESASQEELEKKGCYIGEVPSPVDAFWGSDAQKCMDPEKRFVSENKDKYFGWNGKAPFLFHVCVQDWRCQVYESKTPIFWVEKDKKEYLRTYTRANAPITIAEVSTQAGNDSIYTMNKIDTIAHDGAFSTRFYTPDVVKVVWLDVGYECFKKGNDRLCIIKTVEDPEYQDKIGITALFKDDSKSAFLLNMKFQLFSKDYVHKESTKFHHKDDNLSPASVQDLENILNSLSYSLDETHFNTELLNARINILFNVVTDILLSTGKVDDELIPNVLNRKGKTKWLNDKLFQVCPCYDPKIPENSNCNDNFIYQDGRLREVRTADQCVKFDLQNIQRVSFDKNESITISELAFPPVLGSASAWDGWSWVNAEKENIVSASIFHQQEMNTPNSVLSQISNYTIDGLWAKFTFVFTTSFLTYINTAVLAIFVIRHW